MLPDAAAVGPGMLGAACVLEGASCVATATGATVGEATCRCAGAAGRAMGLGAGTSDCCLTIFLMTGGGGGGGGGVTAFTNRICITGVAGAGVGVGTRIDITAATSEPSIASAATIAIDIALLVRGRDVSVGHSAPRAFPGILMFILIDSGG